MMNKKLSLKQSVLLYVIVVVVGYTAITSFDMLLSLILPPFYG